MTVVPMTPIARRGEVLPGDLPSLGALLLDRTTQIRHSDAARRLVAGRVAVVTGGAGSIGSELVRQLRDLGAEVFVLDNDEASLYALALEQCGHGLLDDRSLVLADVTDRGALATCMQRIRPELVFHAAAVKHLPLLERFPATAIRTNVLGTANVLETGIAAGARCFVNVSTDKAASPVSILGTTKRAAEQLFLALGPGDPRRCSVRFGNVLGSSGSFLEALAWQVEHRRGVTVTHPDVTRYFMSIPEAVSLVVEAAVMARSGETYVLDMGEPVRIVDLVHRYVDAMGAGDIPIEFSGLRSGEKLHEDLFDGSEERSRTRHPSISRTSSVRPIEAQWWDRLEAMRSALDAGAIDAAVELLRSLLPPALRHRG
jgi:FlaA1/EpsC-like NDP-sugar epimerase